MSKSTEWKPTKDEEEAMRGDQEHINKMYEYRSLFEDSWIRYAKKWNMLALEDDPETGISNFVVPLSRMVTSTGIISMRQDLPDVLVKPANLDDRKKAELIRDASAHIDRMCNMESQMDSGITEYAVLGNMVLEDYVKIPYKSRRKIKLNDEGKKIGFTTITERDWSKSKLGTRQRSIWECAFDHRARNVREIRACTFQDRISFKEFETQYMSGNPNAPDYVNTEAVEKGYVYTFGDKNQLERQERNDDIVIIDHYQNEDGDIYRIYANGVLIWDVPLSSVHRHGKITLSLIPNHVIFDKNLKTQSLYGAGDPQLIEDLDDLVNASTNQFITNMARKNSYIVGIENGNIDDFNIESGDVFQGKVSVQTLGAADMGEYQAFKNTIEELAIQVSKKNFKQIQGETARTAFEAAQKQRNSDMGLEHQIKVMEAGGLYMHFYKRIYDIMEHMTIEELEEITEEDIKRMEGFDVAKEDVVIDEKTKKPTKIKHREKFATRGQVYEEIFIKGKRHVDGLRTVKEAKGSDGSMTAHKEYLWTYEYITKGHIPDFYVIGKTMEGRDRNMELAQMERFTNIVIALKNLDPNLKVKAMGILERSIEALDIMDRDEIIDADDQDKEKMETINTLNEMQSILKNQVPLTPDVPLQENIQPQGSQSIPQVQNSIPVLN